MTDLLSIKTGDTIQVTLTLQYIDMNNSRAIHERLMNIAATHPGDITIDMANVISIDSSTIAMLVEFNRQMKEEHRSLTIINLTPAVRRVLDMLHITKFFTIR